MHIHFSSPVTTLYGDEFTYGQCIRDAIKHSGIVEDTEDASVFIVRAREISGGEYVTKKYLNEIKDNGHDLNIILKGYLYGELRGSVTIDEVFGVKIPSTELLVTDSKQGRVILYNNKEIGLYMKEYNTILMGFDMCKITSYSETYNMLDEFLNEVVKISNMTEEEYNSKINDRHIDSIIKALDTANINNIRDIEQRLDEALYRNNALRSELKKNFDLYKSLELQLATLKNVDNKKDKIKKDIQTIMGIDNISSIFAVDNTIIVNTELLYGMTEHGRMFKLAPYKISINFSSGEIRFNCPDEYKREGLWSHKDMHPHIGKSGESCWGNISATIAQLVSDGEILALVTVLLNYLESINTDDAAGACCCSWDEVDPDTLELIREGEPGLSYETGRTENQCTLCGYTSSDDDCIVWCDNCNSMVCIDCATYCEDSGEWFCDSCGGAVECAQCGLSYTSENITTCNNCGCNICDECAVILEVEGNSIVFCHEGCMETWGEAHVTHCEFCHTDVLADHAFTCEKCYTQTCSECIILGEDNIYRCPDCADELEESGEANV